MIYISNSENARVGKIISQPDSTTSFTSLIGGIIFFICISCPMYQKLNVSDAHVFYKNDYEHNDTSQL